MQIATLEIYAFRASWFQCVGGFLRQRNPFHTTNPSVLRKPLPKKANSGCKMASMFECILK